MDAEAVDAAFGNPDRFPHMEVTDQHQGNLARIRGQYVTSSGVNLLAGVWSVWSVGLSLAQGLRH